MVDSGSVEQASLDSVLGTNQEHLVVALEMSRSQAAPHL